MSRARIVVDNSAILPAYIPETSTDQFDAGLVTNRSRSLVHMIRIGRVQAFVPPSFFREFLNVLTIPLFKPNGRTENTVERTRAQWENLLSLPFQTVDIRIISGLSGELVLDDGCPASDSWYVAAALQAQATFWMSHPHADGLYQIASQHVDVKLLSTDTPSY